MNLLVFDKLAKKKADNCHQHFLTQFDRHGIEEIGSVS